MVTIKDIAREAGVSYSTVSVALGNRTSKLPLAEKTRQKVMEVANRLGYRRNALAAQMQTGKTGFLSFIACNASHEYVFNIFSGAIKNGNNEGYSLKLHEIPIDSEYEDRQQDITGFYDHILESRPEGIIIASWVPYLDYLLHEARLLRIPVGCSDCKSDDAFDVKAVFNAFQGEYETVKWLYEQGHRNFGFISDELNHLYVRPRLAGFLGALKDLGIKPDKEWMIHAEHRTDDAVIRFVGQMSRRKKRPTAICCSSDYVALQVLTAATGCNWRVPEELSLVGFGNIDFTLHTCPRLSTVEQDYKNMGARLVERMIEHIRNPELKPEEIVFPTSFKPRESSRSL